jgi:hypothetical protein
MNRMRSLLAPALLCASLHVGAQTVATPPPPVPATTPGRAVVTTTTEPRRPGEPEVRHIVGEDDNARIDELRVRSVPQRIVVATKGTRVPSYEIITGDGSRDLGDGANTSRGAAGKRVWRVLDF